MKKFLVKGNEYFLDFEVHDSYYEIIAYNKGKKKVGYVTMTLTFGENTRNIWLMRIFVEESERFKGIGQKLLDALEYFAKSHLIDNIEGKYYPDNEYAKVFYEKNGYEIWKDGYETYVTKSFYFTKKNQKQNFDKEMLELFK